MSDKKLELVDPATGKKAVLPVRSGTVRSSTGQVPFQPDGTSSPQ